MGRVARGVLAVVVGLAALGLFGGAGPLVRTSTSVGGLEVEYDRFGRLDAPLAMTIHLPPGDSSFALEGDLASRLRIEGLSPSAQSETAVADGVRYVIRGGRVRIHARPQRFGVLDGAVVLEDGARANVRLVVYP